MSDHKDWATPENLYRAADNADAAGFTEYGWKLQGSAERIESLWAEIESLQREKAELQSLADAAGMDAERAITRAGKAELDLKCLQESTVDAKAYQALQRENEELKADNEAKASLIGKYSARLEQSEASAITPEMREKWHRVASLNPVAGIVYNEPNEVWPEDGEWVLIEIESASGISYETRVHDDRSWPSFGVRWAYIRDLLGEQDD